MRLFVAVPLPADAARRAAALVPAHPVLRAVAPELMHVTLAFLGQIPPAALPRVADAAAQAASRHAPFDVRFDHLGAFPASGDLRVIWIGPSAGRDALLALGDDVRRALRDRGIAFDAKPLQAHTTLARVRERARDDTGDLGVSFRDARVSAIDVRVDEIVVFESLMGQGGPRYARRAAAPLRPVGEPGVRRPARDVEETLRRLEDSGELRGLRGEGAPLPTDPDAAAGEEWAARHLVRTANVVPAWLELRREIADRAARLRRRAAAHGEWLVERDALLRHLPADRILEARRATAQRDARVRAKLSAEAAEINTLIRRHNLHVTSALQLLPLDATRL